MEYTESTERGVSYLLNKLNEAEAEKKALRLQLTSANHANRQLLIERQNLLARLETYGGVENSLRRQLEEAQKPPTE